jgi:subtilisin-like proprotein convertase family protein
MGLSLRRVFALSIGFVVALTAITAAPQGPPPSLSVGDATVTEGNSGTTEAVFTVTLSAPSDQTVTVSYATSDRSAASAGTATFASASPIALNDNGAATPYPWTVSVPALGPVAKVTVTLNGFSHPFPLDMDVMLVGPGGQAVLLMSDVGGADAAFGLTLTFDDEAAAPVPPDSLASGSYRPTNSGAGDVFPRPAPASAGSALSVFDGTLPAGDWRLYLVDDEPEDVGSLTGWSLTLQTTGGDYVAASGTLTLPPGATSGTIAATVNGDAAAEPDETFALELGQPVNATIADGEGLGTIENDDGPAPLLSIGDATVAEGDSGPTSALFTLSLSAPSAETVTVSYATADGTAATGVSSVVSSPGAVTINDNGVASPYPSTLEVPPLGFVTKATVALAGLSHGFPQDVDILLVAPTGDSVVLMSDAGGGSPGVSNASLVFDDAASSPIPASSLASGTYRPTNLEDDPPAADDYPVPAPAGPYGSALSAFDGINPTGTWSLYVVDDAGPDDGTIAGGWSLTLQTTGGDYTASSGTLDFPPGTSARTLAVAANGDRVEEADETFLVNLSGPVNAGLGDAQAAGTILDDDASDFHVLTVTRSGSGGGTVYSFPAGIECGADCSETYASGSMVALGPSAAPGSTFTGWSDACSGAGSCQLTMDAAKTVNASFTASAPGSPTLDTVAGGAITVGGTATLTGTNFTAGTVIKLFVNTGGSIDDVSGGSGFTPASWTPTSLSWDLPASVPLGQGFGSLFVVNTDQGFTTSNTQLARLYGDAADNIPTVTAIDGTPLSTALDPGVPVAHADTVVTPGLTVTIAGTGFNNPGVNLFAADLDNPGQVRNYGPFFPGGSPTGFQLTVPASVPAGPANFQVVNNPYTGNVQSNSVSAVAGARLDVTSVTISGNIVTIRGAGFSPLSVINLFNLQGPSVVNLGGLDGSGQPNVPLVFVDSTELRFTRPAAAQAGAAFVEVLNPPYIPFSSSGDDPGGAFAFP